MPFEDKIVRGIFALSQFWGILPHSDFYIPHYTGYLLNAKNKLLMLCFIIGFILALYVSFTYDFGWNIGSNNDLWQIRFISNYLSLFAYIPKVFFPKQHWNGLLKIVKESKKVMDYEKYRKFVYFYLLLLVIFHIIFITACVLKFNNNPIIKTTLSLISGMGVYYEFVGAMTFSIMVILGVEQKLLEMLRILRELHKKKIISMRSIKELKRLFISLFENHQLINDYFCIKLLFSYGCFFGRCLSFLLIITHYYKAKVEYNHRKEPIPNVTTPIDKWFVLAFTNIFTLISVVVIAMTCKQVSQHVTNVIMNCYLLQSKIRYNSYEYKEIRALWMFIFENRLSFTAAGFFDVQPSILLSIFASSITYFLVLV